MTTRQRCTEAAERSYLRQMERAAIGGLILKPATLDEVRGWLRPDDFALPHYGRWYTRLLEMREAGTPIDQMTLLTELRHRNDLGPDGSWAFELATIAEHVPLPGDPEPYARAVLEESLRRQLDTTGARLQQLAHADPPGRLLEATALLQRTLEAASRRWHRASGPPPTDELARPLILARDDGPPPDLYLER